MVNEVVTRLGYVQAVRLIMYNLSAYKLYTQASVS